MNEVIQDGSNQSPLLTGQSRPQLDNQNEDIDDQVFRYDDLGQEENKDRNMQQNTPSSGGQNLRSLSLGGSQRQQQISAISSVKIKNQPIGQNLKSSSHVSMNSQMRQTKTQKLIKKPTEELITELTFWAKILIVLYHLIEPTLLGIIIGFSLQISEMSTIVYLLISLLILMPMMLTNDRKKINIKCKLTIFMTAIVPVLIFFKTWIYCQFTQTTNISKELSDFFGVFPSQFAKTYIIDMVVFFMSCLLVWHYYSQRAQLEAREKSTGTRKYQTKIKFLHFFFGESLSAFYYITFILFLLDTFVFQTLIQLLISSLQLGLLFYWATDNQISIRIYDLLLRFIQVLSFIMLACSFTLEFPVLLNGWISNHLRILELIGFAGTSYSIGQNLDLRWYIRIHRILLSFALVIAEVYFVCKQVKNQNLRATKIQEIGVKRQPIINKNQVIQEKLTWQEYILRSWRNSKVTIILWICRFFCLIQVYMLHDYQALPFLVWLLCSTLFKRANFFVRLTNYFFYPLMISIYLFYYAVNIYGVIDWNEEKWQQTNIQAIQMYKYGFFHMNVPFLQFGYLYLVLVFFALYIRFFYEKERNKVERFVDNNVRSNMWALEKSTLTQLYYLLILYINYPIFLFLIMSGLAKMDFYHVFMLFVFVWAALKPSAFQKHVIWVLIYADFFVLIKYIYTLVITQIPQNQNSQWYTIIGISSVYDPNSTQEFFRYSPKLDQWLLVLLTFAQYRRANILGTDPIKIEQTEQKVINSLVSKYPLTFKILKYLSIILNHSVVIFTFLTYLLLITFLRRSCLNFVIFLMILSLLAAYLQQGIKMLLKYWKFVSFYTAFVLLSQLAYQFIATMDFGVNLYENLTLRQQAYIYWIGYYKFNEPLWKDFLPGVAMFFFSVLLQGSFKLKYEREIKDLSLAVEQNKQSLNGEQIEIITVNPAFQPSQLQQDEFVSQRQQKLIDKQNVYYDMQYKLSFLLWKVQVIWPILDFISQYFNLVLSVAILSFAIYFQIAILWLLYLILYLIQTCRVHRVHSLYKEEQKLRFKNNILGGPQITSSAQTARVDKLVVQSNEMINNAVIQDIIKLQEDKKNIPQDQLEERLIVSDEQVMIEYQNYEENIQFVTLESRNRFWLIQFILLILSFALIYTSIFITAKYPEQPNAAVYISFIQNIDTQNLFLFIAFWAGLYRSSLSSIFLTNNRELMQEYYSFYIFLLLLIMEKLCQLWLKDRFGTTLELIEVFKKIESDQFKQLEKGRQSQTLQASYRSQQLQDAIKQNSLQQSFGQDQFEKQPVQVELSNSVKNLQISNLIEEEKQEPLATRPVTGQLETKTQLIIQDNTVNNQSNQANVQLNSQNLGSSFSKDRQNSLLIEDGNSSNITVLKQELMEQIKPRINIKNKILFDQGIQVIILEIVIMLVWFSCIYKQNILSFFLFFVLVIHTYRHKFKFNTFSFVQYTVAVVFIAQYVSAILCLSSYNTPTPMPQQITSPSMVYPNSEHNYLAIPIYFNISQVVHHQTPPTVSLQWTSFWSFFVGNKRLNGIWIDFVVTAILYLYLNMYNLWLFSEPHKIETSDETKSLLRRYQDLLKVNPSISQSDQSIKKSIKNELLSCRLYTIISTNIYTNFGLLMIMFILFISIFSKSLLSFGYFIFCMLLIYNNRTFFVEPNSSINQIQILSVLMPYLLIDIFLQLLYQIPFEINNYLAINTQTILSDIGFLKIWNTYPTSLMFGEQNILIVEQLNNGVAALFLKGLTYFMISIQIQILNSSGFKKFNDKLLLNNVLLANSIGKGIAYRQNNFKNQKVLQQAKDYANLERMLQHVKNLIKIRDKIGKEKSSPNIKSEQSAKKQKSIEVIEEENVEESISQTFLQTGIQNDFKTAYKTDVESIYSEKLKKLDYISKLYLMMRHNLVQDILFKHSNQHLEDIVEQFRLGRTSIRTQLEIGLMHESKTEALDKILAQLTHNSEIGDYSDQKKLKEFLEFSAQQLDYSEQKPWECLDPNYKSKKKLALDFITMIWKIIASHTHLICYFFMLWATISNGGLIYMIYPCLIFGFALMKESTPGKQFWYFIIIYTQIIIFCQFFVQLNFWQIDDPNTGVGKIFTFSQMNNIGLIHIPQDSYSFRSVLQAFYAEILILAFVLIHIQQETLAGLFNVKLEDFESFEDGLERYIKIVLEDDKVAYQSYLKQHVDIIIEQKPKIKRSNSAPELLYPQNVEEDQAWFLINSDLDLQILRNGLNLEDIDKYRVRSNLTMVDKSEMEAMIQEIKHNQIQRKTIWGKMLFFFEKNSRFLWDRHFFEQLFPLIRQQKPGKDLYVWITGTCVFIFFYVFIFYGNMAKQKSTIAEQINSNQLQTNMVLSELVIMTFMVLDRVFYTTYSFISNQIMRKKIDTNSPLIEQDATSSNFTENSNIKNRQASQSEVLKRPFSNTELIGKRGRAYTQNINQSPESNNSDGRQKQGDVSNNDLSLNKTQTLLNVDFTKESEDNIGDTINLKKQQAYYQSLIPQVSEKSAFRVFKFYYVWVIIIVSHWYVFFFLVKQKMVCPVLEPYCNRVAGSGNASLLIFYLTVCIYLILQSYQIQIGLPELKKGGFLQGSYNSVSKTIFQIWYYIPFLFELRTIIDWSFSSTSLDVFQAIKLAQVQADLFIAKCTNKPYIERDLGEKQPWYIKLAIGGSLLFFVLFLIAFPMILFSQLNPVSQPNPVTQASLSLQLVVKNQTQSIRIPMFETTQVIQLQELQSSQFEAMNFTLSTETNYFKPYQVQSIQFSNVSDTVWLLAPPKITYLIQVLNSSLYNLDSNIILTAELVMQFTRESDKTSPVAKAINSVILNSLTPDILQNLTSMIQCDPTVNETYFPPDSATMLYVLSQGSAATQISDLGITTGATLSYQCDGIFGAENYWTLQQNWPINNSYYDSEKSIFPNPESGFGVIVFNRNVFIAALASYASSILIFYATIVYIVATSFRSAFVPNSYQIYIIDAVNTEDIIMICQCIYIYRVQNNLKNEEELYMILIDIMRSPETLKSITGTSMKKKLD